MKQRLLLLLLTVVLSTNAYSQNSITDILSNSEKATEKLYAVYDLNVFWYYELVEYNTELKREVFKKTSEYQKYLSELKKIRTEMFKKSYYIKRQGLFEENNYDVKKGGFNVVVSKNNNMDGDGDAMPPKSIALGRSLFTTYCVQLRALPVRQVPDILFGSKGLFDENLLISLPAEKGLEIEENNKDVDIYFLFTPATRASLKVRFYSRGSGWLVGSNTTLIANKCRVIVVNRKTGDIYFNKSYTYTPPTKK